MVSSVTAGVVTWVADLAVFVPVYIPYPYPVNRVFWANGSTITASNAEFGIYTRAGKRIYSTGAVALAGASVPQFVTPATPFVLAPGAYYFAYMCSGTTSRHYGTSTLTANILKSIGVLQQAAANPLPDPAVFATPANALYPFCGVTRTMSGF